MQPVYMAENRYSYSFATLRRPSTSDYQADTPETAFERQVQSLYLEGQTHLQHEEFSLGLQAFRELMALILHTANPRMPVDPTRFPYLRFPMELALVDTLSTKAAQILQRTPLTQYNFPGTLTSAQSILPDSVTPTANGPGW